MASEYGPNMQAFVGPTAMDRQDIARLTKFHKLLLDHERVVEQGGEMPSIADLRDSFDHIIFEPMVTTWLAEPTTAAGVIRFVVAELGDTFSGSEIKSQISSSGFAGMLNQAFLDQLDLLSAKELLTRDTLLDLFYEHHVDDMPVMPGQFKERATVATIPEPGSFAESYTEVARKAKLISEHSVFRGMIGLLIVGVVVITGMDTYEPVARPDDEVAKAAEDEAKAQTKLIEAVIIFVFFSEVVLKFVAQGMLPWRFFHVSLKPGQAAYTPHDHMQWVFDFRHWLSGIQGWNLFDFLVVLVCIAQQTQGEDSGGMVVLRMVRLIKVLQIFMEIGQIRAVLIGLGDGLHSLIFILLVFSVIFYVYGLVGLYMFGTSDEFHYSNLGFAATTMARMAMGPWQDVLYINLYGCLDDKSQLPTPQIQEEYCSPEDHVGNGLNSDVWRKVAVLFYFITFKAVCGFVALSLLFGVITTAMSKALEETNASKFEALRLKRQEGAHKMLLRRRNAARMEAEVDIVQRYATKWWNVTGKVHLKIETVPGVTDDPATLHKRRRVYVTGATNLPLSDGTEKNPTAGDPYAVVYWNDEELFRTDIVYNSVDPLWDESGIIWVAKEGGTLRVEIFDWDKDENMIPGVARSDSFQGEYSLTIGSDDESLGGAKCEPSEGTFKLTEHVVRHINETAILNAAAEAAAVSMKERTPAQLTTIRKALATVRWFQVNCPNEAALLSVSKYVKKKTLKEGEVLFNHGANANSMFVVFSGTILLKDQARGKTVARLGSGATVGERALMGDMDELMENVDDQYGSDSDQEDDIEASKRYTTAIATCDTVVGRLTKEKFYSVPNRRLGEGSHGGATGLVLSYKKVSLKCFSLVHENWFHWFIVACILVQAIVLGLETTVRNHELIKKEDLSVEVVNFILLSVFTFEVLLKICAFMNPWQEWAWFYDPWTAFDTAIVVMSHVPFTPDGLLILRVLRLFRVLKEFNSLPQLQMIVNGLIDAITGLWFVMLLLILTVYFYSIIGMQLFGVNDYMFRSLHYALLNLASVATEGGWPALMYTNMYGCRDYYRPGHRCCTEIDAVGLGNDTIPWKLVHPDVQALCLEHYAQPVTAAVYFCSFRLLVAFIILKLVVGTIISSMQAESKLHDEVVEVYKAVKLLCAQYRVGVVEMRNWMEAINAFDQFGHGFISTDQVDGVVEVLEFHLDEDLNYKMHWHLQQSKGQIHITEFVEYLCCQHMRIDKAKQEGVDMNQTAMGDAESRLQKFANPLETMGQEAFESDERSPEGSSE